MAREASRTRLRETPTSSRLQCADAARRCSVRGQDAKDVYSAATSDQEPNGSSRSSSAKSGWPSTSSSAGASGSVSVLSRLAESSTGGSGGMTGLTSSSPPSAGADTDVLAVNAIATSASSSSSASDALRLPSEVGVEAAVSSAASSLTAAMAWATGVVSRDRGVRCGSSLAASRRVRASLKHDSWKICAVRRCGRGADAPRRSPRLRRRRQSRRPCPSTAS